MQKIALWFAYQEIKQKKQEVFFIPPVKIYTSRNINSMFIIQIIKKKYKLL